MEAKVYRRRNYMYNKAAAKCMFTKNFKDRKHQVRNLPSNLQHARLTPHSNTCHHLLPSSPQKTTTTTIRNRPPMATHRHSHPCQRHTTLEIQLLRPWHRPSLGPAQGPTPKRGPSLDQKRAPQTMSPPHSGGTYFGGCKVDLKSSPYLAAVKRSLLLEFSGRMYLHAATRQRSNGSDGSRSVPDALLCV